MTLDTAGRHVPYALKSAAERERRRTLRGLPHIAPLADLRDRIADDHGVSGVVPGFDPESGGVHARVLLLWETPGPDALESGYVSLDNPDQTARNLHRLLHDAGIARSDTLLWSIVPWWIGAGIKKRIAPASSGDLEAGLGYLPRMFALLPRLQTVVLLGKKAHALREPISTLTTTTLLNCPYPSPQVFNTLPDKKRETQEVLEEVAVRLTEDV